MSSSPAPEVLILSCWWPSLLLFTDFVVLVKGLSSSINGCKGRWESGGEVGEVMSMTTSSSIAFRLLPLPTSPDELEAGTGVLADFCCLLLLWKSGKERVGEGAEGMEGAVLVILVGIEAKR